MSNKELITAYVGEWAKQIGRNPINPANGVIMEKSDDGHVCFIWKEHGMCWWWKVGADKLHNGSTHFDLLVRILRLEKPIAKPIEWRDWLVIRGCKVCYSVCDTYMLEREQGGGVLAYYIGDDRRELVGNSASGMAEAKLYEDCQAHKQAAYDKMGGWI